MILPKEECENAIWVLKETILALKEKNPIKLKDLSNRTIHSSCTYQDSGSITSAVLIYALSKLIERSDFNKIASWNSFEKKCISTLELAIDALKKDKHEAYENHLLRARQLLESASGNLKPYIKEVLNRASINKASKIHEHGISSEQTARLLGLTQWEISEYIGTRDANFKIKEKLTVEKRAKEALEFFS